MFLRRDLEYVFRAEHPIAELDVEAGDLIYVNLRQQPPVTVVKEHGRDAVDALQEHLRGLTRISASPNPLPAPDPRARERSSPYVARARRAQSA